MSAALIAAGCLLLGGSLAREKSLARGLLPTCVLFLGTPAFALALSSAPEPALAFVLTAAGLTLVRAGRREWRAPVALLLGIAASLYVSPGPGRLSFVTEGLFGLPSGLFVRSPLLWLAVAGLVADRRREALPAGLCGLLALAGSASAAPGSRPSVLLGVALALLFTPLARALDRLESVVRAHPGWAVGVVAAALTLWNALSMESYRKALVPRDDTVAFSRLAEHNAAVLRSWVGTPVAWPANLSFAGRTGLSAARWDRLGSAYLFEPAPGLSEAISLGGEDGSVEGLLDGDWGGRVPCPPAACRELAGVGQVFFGLRHTEPLSLVLEARGAGSLELRLNGQALASLPLGEPLEARTVRLAPSFLVAGLNRLELASEKSGRLQVARLVFHREGP